MGEGFGFTLGVRSFFANLHVGIGEGGLRASASAGSPRKASLGRGGGFKEPRHQSLSLK